MKVGVKQPGPVEETGEKEKYEQPDMPDLYIDGADLPDRGSMTGIVMGEMYGASLDKDATNVLGGMGDVTNSDPMTMTNRIHLAYAQAEQKPDSPSWGKPFSGASDPETDQFPNPVKGTP